MILLREECSQFQVLLTESVNGKKEYFIEGVFLQGDIKNNNSRIYSLDVLKPEVERYITEKVKPVRAFGELGHPDSPQINLERVSHIITNLDFRGSDCYGKAKIIDTPYGKIVKNFLDEGAKLGVSSRALGSVKKDQTGVEHVQNDLRIFTAADIVADPSAPDAFVRSIMEEKEWIFQNGVVASREIEDYKTQIQKATSRKLEETTLRVWNDFLRRL